MHTRELLWRGAAKPWLSRKPLPSVFWWQGADQVVVNTLECRSSHGMRNVIEVGIAEADAEARFVFLEDVAQFVEGKGWLTLLVVARKIG